MSKSTKFIPLATVIQDDGSLSLTLGSQFTAGFHYLVSAHRTFVYNEKTSFAALKKIGEEIKHEGIIGPAANKGLHAGTITIPPPPPPEKSETFLSHVAYKDIKVEDITGGKTYDISLPTGSVKKWFVDSLLPTFPLRKDFQHAAKTITQSTETVKATTQPTETIKTTIQPSETKTTTQPTETTKTNTSSVPVISFAKTRSNIIPQKALRQSITRSTTQPITQPITRPTKQITQRPKQPVKPKPESKVPAQLPIQPTAPVVQPSTIQPTAPVAQPSTNQQTSQPTVSPLPSTLVVQPSTEQCAAVPVITPAVSLAPTAPSAPIQPMTVARTKTLSFTLPKGTKTIVLNLV